MSKRHDYLAEGLTDLEQVAVAITKVSNTISNLGYGGFDTSPLEYIGIMIQENGGSISSSISEGFNELSSAIKYLADTIKEKE